MKYLHGPDTTQRLSTVSADIVILICTYLKGKDILSLRQTCKSVEEATRERTVWLYAAQKSCQDNALYEPAFDLPTMTNQELEFLSMGIHRFNQLVQSAWSKAVSSDMPADHDKGAQQTSNYPDPPVLTATRTNKIPLSVQLNSGTRFQAAVLVPGGRFLITQAGIRLDIFDLSLANVDENVSLAPCVSFDLPGIFYFTTHASHDANVLRILVCFYDNEADSTRRRVYITEIIDVERLNCGTPTVRRYEKIIVPKPSSYSSVVYRSVFKDDVAIIVGKQLTIANCAKGLFAQWITPIVPDQLIVTDTEVFVMSPCTSTAGEYEPQELLSSVLIYRRPPLTLDSVALWSHQPQMVMPDVVLRLPSQVRPYFTCTTMHNAYTGSVQSLWFDLTHSSISPTDFTRARIIKEVNGQYAFQIFPPSASEKQRVPTIHQFPTTIYGTVYESSTKISKWWTHRKDDGGRIVCSMEDAFPSSGQLAHISPSAELFDWKKSRNSQEFYLGGLCAVSGKLVHILGEEMSGEKVVYAVVTDYLPIGSDGNYD